MDHMGNVSLYTCMHSHLVEPNVQTETSSTYIPEQ